MKLLKCIFYLFIISLISAVNSNIITLQNNSYVTCVSANISSPIFVIPLNTTVNGYTSSMLEKIDLTADNWILKNERVVGSVIVDKRWEGRHVYNLSLTTNILI
jgi:hypothetical protein